jgi:hypothetical protein
MNVSIETANLILNQKVVTAKTAVEILECLNDFELYNVSDSE